MSKEWFVWTADCRFDFYESKAEAISAAQLLVPKYFDGFSWEEGIEEIKVGCLTHQIVQIDRIERPDVTDDDDCDLVTGENWGCLSYKCNYQLVPNPVEVLSTIDMSSVSLVSLEQSPIEKFNPPSQYWRFNSLPFEIQENLVKHLIVLRDNSSIFKVSVTKILNNLLVKSDAEIVQLHQAWLTRQ